jgi:hypothetical protein
MALCECVLGFMDAQVLLTVDRRPPDSLKGALARSRLTSQAATLCREGIGRVANTYL